MKTGVRGFVEVKEISFDLRLEFYEVNEGIRRMEEGTKLDV